MCADIWDACKRDTRTEMAKLWAMANPHLNKMGELINGLFESNMAHAAAQPPMPGQQGAPPPVPGSVAPRVARLALQGGDAGGGGATRAEHLGSDHGDAEEGHERGGGEAHDLGGQAGVFGAVLRHALDSLVASPGNAAGRSGDA